MGGVKGILLDSSVLFSSGIGDDAILSLGAQYVLDKLRYSGIPIGISCYHDLSSSKEGILQELSTTYSCPTIFSSSPNVDITNEVACLWEGEGLIIGVVSGCEENTCSEGRGPAWLNVIVGSDGTQASKYADYDVASGTLEIIIHKLEELPLLICQLNKKACSEECSIVGYLMKPSRENDFLKRGAFPMCPTQNGLIFVPLTFEVSIASQLCQVDSVLHKLTDEILSVDLSSASEHNITFTRNFLELQRGIKNLPNCCVIDPFDKIFPVVDRLKIQQILFGLDTIYNQGSHRIRAPHFVKVDNFEDPQLEQRLAEAKLSFPIIVKPQVACGVSDAHNMAIVFCMNQYKNLNVPLPAVIQEYIDHSSVLYKFYVLGSQTFYTVKKSIPNSNTLRNSFTEKTLKPLEFNSLRSLPVAKDQPNASVNQIDLELVYSAADWLRGVLDLTVIGFDVVVQENTGDHVIVDLNYLPSFKEIPDDVAVPSFWKALKDKIISSKTKQGAPVISMGYLQVCRKCLNDFMELLRVTLDCPRESA